MDCGQLRLEEIKSLSGLQILHLLPLQLTTFGAQSQDHSSSRQRLESYQQMQAPIPFISFAERLRLDLNPSFSFKVSTLSPLLLSVPPPSVPLSSDKELSRLFYAMHGAERLTLSWSECVAMYGGSEWPTQFPLSAVVTQEIFSPNHQFARQTWKQLQ